MHIFMDKYDPNDPNNTGTHGFPDIIFPFTVGINQSGKVGVFMWGVWDGAKVILTVSIDGDTYVKIEKFKNFDKNKYQVTDFPAGEYRIKAVVENKGASTIISGGLTGTSEIPHAGFP